LSGEEIVTAIDRLHPKIVNSPNSSVEAPKSVPTTVTFTTIKFSMEI